jgi:hypothetical protein
VYKIELEHYLLYLLRGKVFICGLAEALSVQKRLGLQITNPQNTKPQITKIQGPQIRHICGRPATPANYLSPQIFGFPICRT